MSRSGKNQPQNNYNSLKKPKLHIKRGNISLSIKKPRLSKEKRIEYEKCLDWARKHQKDGSHYERLLHKGQDNGGLDMAKSKRKMLLLRIKTQNNVDSCC